MNVSTIDKLSLKVGEKIFCLVNDNCNRFLIESDNPSLNGNNVKTLSATVLLHDSFDFHRPYFVGWKEGEKKLGSVTLMEYCLDDIIYSGVWIVKNTLVVLDMLPSVSRGMHCSGKFCSEFNAYAEPNTGDGLYFCYSCRQRPDYLK